MANKKISDLSSLAASDAVTGDLIEIVDISEASASDQNKKITYGELFGLKVQKTINVAGSGGTGDIHTFVSGQAGMYDVFVEFDDIQGSAAATYHVRADSGGVTGMVQMDVHTNGSITYSVSSDTLRVVNNDAGAQDISIRLSRTA